MHVRSSMLLILVATALPVLTAARAHADGSWLDQPNIIQWNISGAALPTAPDAPAFAVSASCAAQQRPAETDEDQQVNAAGWMLTGEYASGWGIRVVTGTSGWSGVCAPYGYQEFVFMDDQFVGTISPVLMSNGDGAAPLAVIARPFSIIVMFGRYTSRDPRCCPSAMTHAEFVIVRAEYPPVLALIFDSTAATR